MYEQDLDVSIESIGIQVESIDSIEILKHFSPTLSIAIFHPEK